MRRSVLITVIMVSLICGARAKADDVAFAYCPLGEGYVFLYESLTGFGVVANLNCGEQVTVLDVQDKDRARVRTANGKEGYVFKYTITTDPSGKPLQPAISASDSSGQTQPKPRARSQSISKSQLPSKPRPPVQARSESQPTSAVVRPRAELELFAGYSYLRANIVFSGAPLSTNGASSSVAFYFNDWFGVMGDFALYHQGNVVNSGFSLTFSSYQFGPTLRYRNQTRLTPFAHFIWGGGHAGGTLYTRSLGFGVPALGAGNGFVLTGGGGADWRLSPAITIRLVEADYLHSEFLNVTGSNRQENIRLSTGVVFTFGRE